MGAQIGEMHAQILKFCEGDMCINLTSSGVQFNTAVGPPPSDWLLPPCRLHVAVGNPHYVVVPKGWTADCSGQSAVLQQYQEIAVPALT